ncbi:hypothetical protein KIF59_05080 [Enterobacter cloacae subsp. cloacae]|nr:hypothetical protein [Enterobacter cloacae subsp. cloacae]
MRRALITLCASPSGQWQDIANSGLKPVMTLRSESSVCRLKGRRYGGLRQPLPGDRRNAPLTLWRAVADGYPAYRAGNTWSGVDRSAYGSSEHAVDMLAVDLTPCPQAGGGSPVGLWGNEVKIDDVAAAAGT